MGASAGMDTYYRIFPGLEIQSYIIVHPLLCPECAVSRWIVVGITEPAVVDRILAHLVAKGGRNSVAARGPPEG